MREPTTIEIKHDGARVGAVAHPRENGAAAPVVLVCDDPWTGGATDLVDEITEGLVASGLAVASLDPSPTLADHLDLAADVLAWIESSDAVDAARLGLLGCERGAIVAACIAGKTDAIRRLCLLTPMRPADAVGKPAKSKQARAAADPAEAVVAEIDTSAEVARHARPTLIVHGAADKLVPIAAPLAYREALRGQDVDFELVARGDHEMSDPAARTACVERIAGFFRPKSDKTL
jgi:dienelactone hydrolase